MDSEQGPSSLSSLPPDSENSSAETQIASQPVTFVTDVPGQRLDVAIVAHIADLSRSQVQRLIKSDRVLVNGVKARASYRLGSGDKVAVDVLQIEIATVVAEDIPLHVLYEDDDLIAIDKEAGMVVHPGIGHQSGTLVNAALARWPQLETVGGQQRAGIVHRLDKDTSGAIVLAKTDVALENLQSQFKQRQVEKRYLALVEGVPKSSEGLIDAPVGRDPKHRKRMAVVRDGREAVTRYQLLQAYEEHALLELSPRTGRTHQLRIHLAWLGHPVVGDKVYGFRKQRIKMARHWLHAASLTVHSPSDDRLLTFKAPLPDRLEEVLQLLS